MPTQAVIKTREVERALRALARTRYPKAVAEALNKTAFEMLLSERRHVGSLFDFKGQNTKSFLSGKGSFRFSKATPSRLFVDVFPAPKTSGILVEHTDRRQLKRSEHLTFKGKLAIPVDVRDGRVLRGSVTRGKRGRVGRSRTPKAITGPGGRGFVKGNVILERARRGSNKLRIAYVLVSRATDPPIFKFFDVARRTAARVFAAKARRAIQKIPVRRGR